MKHRNQGYETVYMPGTRFETTRLSEIKETIGLVLATLLASIILLLAITGIVYLAFQDEGVRVFLYACAALIVIAGIYFLVRAGAEISIRSTRVAADVFMRSDMVDAYTDRVRSGTLTPTVQQQQLLDQQLQPSPWESPLPQPKLETKF